MRAISISSPRTVGIIDIPVPNFKDDEVLLRVKKVGLCGSDLATFLGTNPLVSYPMIPGHEIAAVVVQQGEKVPDSMSIGEQVTVVPYTSCGVCNSCIHGRYHACKDNKTLGVGRDGAILEYIAVPWQKLIPAKGLSLQRLVLIEPFSVGFHAVERGGITDEDTVLVFGCGMIGIAALARARLRGARVIMADLDDSKLDIALSLGSDYVINVLKQDLHKTLQKITAGLGPDVVIEAVGSPTTYRQAVEEVAFAGRIICIGYAKDDTELPTKVIVKKELAIRGSRNATALDFAAARRFLSTTDFDIEKLISKDYSLSDTAEALNYWSENPGKVIKLTVSLYDLTE